MKLYCGTIANRRFLDVLLPKRLVFADEVDNLVEGEEGEGEKSKNNKNPAPINYEDLIARARKEEKEKLYPKIKSLEEKIVDMTNTINNHLLTIGGKDTVIADLQAKLKEPKGDETEVVKNLKSQISNLEKQLEDLKSKQPQEVDEEALRTTIRTEIENEYEVKLYRIEKLAEAGEDILTPELVIGTTKEEIDQSIESQKTKTLEIKQKLGIIDEEGNIIKPSTKKPKATPNNPPKNKGQEKVDLEYLASLDPASTEYAEVRKKLGLR